MVICSGHTVNLISLYIVVPTDTIKNTVYAVAYDHRMIDMESYGIKLASRFVERWGIIII